MARLPFWFFIGCILLLPFLCSNHAYAQSAPAARDAPRVAAAPVLHSGSGAIEISTAGFAHTGALTIPSASTAWTPVTLPDAWGKQGRDRSKVGWYRLQIKLEKVPTTAQTLYIPRVTNNVAAFVNGGLIGVSGRIEARELSWNTAQLFFVPQSQLKEGLNDILLCLHPDDMQRAGLSFVHFGDDATLRPRYDDRLFVQTTAPKFIAGLLALTALLSFALWASRRQETVFGFFALLCLVMIARLWHTFARDPESFGHALAAPALPWMIAMQTLFVLRFCNQRSPRFEQFTLGFASLAMLLLWSPFASALISPIFLVNTLLGVMMLAILSRALLKKPRLENLILLVAILTNYALAIHDLLNFQGKLEYDTLYYLPLGGPLLLFAVAVLLIRRFVHVLDEHENLNAQLATRVKDREQELTQSYERLRVLDQQRATAEERQRLMRDMHDGIGSHLMSTLALARTSTLTQKDMQETLADCIDELKITIDSLEPVESDLLVVLGNLRYRLEPRLKAAGIELEWAVTDLPPLAYLDPENTRSILRIVQEAFTNTLKHAKARRITLTTGTDFPNARLWVRVTDDGIGLSPGAAKGRGLQNMHSRATKLNGTVEIVPLKGGGTCLNLYLPLAKMG